MLFIQACMMYTIVSCLVRPAMCTQWPECGRAQHCAAQPSASAAGGTRIQEHRTTSLTVQHLGYVATARAEPNNAVLARPGCWPPTTPASPVLAFTQHQLSCWHLRCCGGRCGYGGRRS